jgi:hypothetical protein
MGQGRGYKQYYWVWSHTVGMEIQNCIIKIDSKVITKLKKCVARDATLEKYLALS